MEAIDADRSLLPHSVTCPGSLPIMLERSGKHHCLNDDAWMMRQIYVSVHPYDTKLRTLMQCFLSCFVSLFALH